MFTRSIDLVYIGNQPMDQDEEGGVSGGQMTV